MNILNLSVKSRGRLPSIIDSPCQPSTPLYSLGPLFTTCIGIYIAIRNRLFGRAKFGGQKFGGFSLLYIMLLLSYAMLPAISTATLKSAICTVSREGSRYTLCAPSMYRPTVYLCTLPP